MALTELIEEMEKQILECEGSGQEEVTELAGDREDAIGETEGVP